MGSRNKTPDVQFGSEGQEHKNKAGVKAKNWGAGGQTHCAVSENLLSSRTGAAAGCAQPSQPVRARGGNPVRVAPVGFQGMSMNILLLGTDAKEEGK